jgi:hypothetical protein
MSKAKYSEIRKKQPGGRYVWGVLQMVGRKQKFQTVGGRLPLRHANRRAGHGSAYYDRQSIQLAPRPPTTSTSFAE